VVDQLDLEPFYRAHRDDGRGHPAYDPKALLGVLLYAYAIGVRSSRQIERRCHEDVAFRVLAGNQTPDHVTIARFRVRHQQALAGFLVESLKLCAAGMVRRGTVALDGTKLAANAAERANRTQEQLEREVAEILRRSPRPTSATTASTATRAGTSCPPRWPPRPTGFSGCGRPRPSWRPRRPNASSATSSGSPSWRPRPGPAASNLERTSSPGRGTRRPKPEAVANVTDPDSRLVHTRKGSLQGYNAQAVTTCEQVVVAAELTQDANDLQQLGPMLEATAATLAAAGIPARPGTVLADSGYWTIANLTQIEGAPELLIPPARHGRQGKPRKDGKPSESRSDGLRAAMTAKLQSEQGKARYAKRKQTVEPVFGQVKDVRGMQRFLRRGLGACTAEWKLLCGTHNLLKLWRHQTARPLATPATN
jgi:transposase